MYQCLICFDSFKKKNTYQCPNDMCNVSICESCLQTWDKMYEKLECPICHTSRMTHDIENQTEQIRMPEEISSEEILPFCINITSLIQSTIPFQY